MIYEGNWMMVNPLAPVDINIHPVQYHMYVKSTFSVPHFGKKTKLPIIHDNDNNNNNDNKNATINQIFSLCQLWKM